ncbi:carbon-nitrogen hydrolase family protein [Streptomyces sp. CA-135486]|uniref:carbon-nitrogen hydrolase family protein n=1 Tax=Streptomyces sp. CA-135486 TaxID=3240049 RepID=UPI003D8AFF2D
MIVAAGQFAPIPGDIEANVHRMDGLIRAAAEQSARVVVFPELALTGYELGLIRQDPGLWPAEDDKRLDPVRQACRATSTVAVVGGPVPTESGRPGISSLVIGPGGGLLARYDCEDDRVPLRAVA